MRTGNEHSPSTGQRTAVGSRVRAPGRRAARLAGAGLLLAATAGGAVVLAAGTAGATACGSPVAAGTACGLTGTLTLSAGSLTLTAPSALSWSGVLNGTDQYLDDTSGSDQSYVVNDATANGAGWNVTVSATQFSTGGSSPATLANTGTLSTNGSLTSATATTAPSASCASGSTCTLPSNSTTYPVAVTTAASSPATVKIYDNAANSGLGQMTIGNVGWWVAVPANALAGTYTSTITFQVSSGP